MRRDDDTVARWAYDRAMRERDELIAWIEKVRARGFQQADEPATIDVFVRVTDDRRDTLRAWLPELIRDHAATAVHARVHVVDHLQLPETS